MGGMGGNPASFYFTPPFSFLFFSFLFTFRREREGMVKVKRRGKARQGKAWCKAASFVYLD